MTGRTVRVTVALPEELLEAVRNPVTVAPVTTRIRNLPVELSGRRMACLETT